MDQPSTSAAPPIIDWQDNTESHSEELTDRPTNQPDQQSRMSCLNLIAQREREIHRFNTIGTEYVFTVNDNDLSINDVYTIFEDLVQYVLSEFSPDDMVGIRLSGWIGQCDLLSLC